jgi:hypothetical protein
MVYTIPTTNKVFKNQTHSNIRLQAIANPELCEGNFCNFAERKY